ncbi:poly-beta-1,6-N-acetyl-D-glucosamine N-deacetylase PgaB [Escherichia coli]
MTEYLRTKVEVNQQLVFFWPYGEANGIAIEELKKLGYDMFFTLESGLANASQLDSIPRVLIANNPSLKEFYQQIITVQEKSPQRIMHIDLDYVYDENLQQMDRNIDVLIQQVKRLFCKYQPCICRHLLIPMVMGWSKRSGFQMVCYQ